MSLASTSIFPLHFDIFWPLHIEGLQQWTEAKDPPLTLPFIHVAVMTVILKLLTKLVRKDTNEQAFQEFYR